MLVATMVGKLHYSWYTACCWLLDDHISLFMDKADLEIKQRQPFIHTFSPLPLSLGARCQFSLLPQIPQLPWIHP